MERCSPWKWVRETSAHQGSDTLIPLKTIFFWKIGLSLQMRNDMASFSSQCSNTSIAFLRHTFFISFLCIIYFASIFFLSLLINLLYTSALFKRFFLFSLFDMYSIFYISFLYFYNFILSRIFYFNLITAADKEMNIACLAPVKAYAPYCSWPDHALWELQPRKKICNLSLLFCHVRLWYN